MAARVGASEIARTTRARALVAVMPASTRNAVSGRSRQICMDGGLVGGELLEQRWRRDFQRAGPCALTSSARSGRHSPHLQVLRPHHRRRRRRDDGGAFRAAGHMIQHNFGLLERAQPYIASPRFSPASASRSLAGTASRRRRTRDGSVVSWRRPGVPPGSGPRCRPGRWPRGARTAMRSWSAGLDVLVASSRSAWQRRIALTRKAGSPDLTHIAVEGVGEAHHLCFEVHRDQTGLLPNASPGFRVRPSPPDSRGRGADTGPEARASNDRASRRARRCVLRPDRRAARCWLVAYAPGARFRLAVPVRRNRGRRAPVHGCTAGSALGDRPKLAARTCLQGPAKSKQ